MQLATAKLKFLLALAVVFAPALAKARQPVPDYDFDWVTVGSPGNRAASQSEAPRFYPPFYDPALQAGAVDHSFRIARTEVTASQWLEFINAFWPYWNGPYNSTALTGRWIVPQSLTPGEDPHFQLPQVAERRPTNTSWLVAIEYCNWLHNDKRTDAQAFTTGAYDVSGISQNPDGSWNLPQSHLPGARFWLPTLDEWTKAMYYDPNKNGPGQDGYWRYETSSDEAPIPGYPWDGGQTSAGININSDPHYYLDVGSYPDVMSPWGLLDGSGSVRELLETTYPFSVEAKGTAAFENDPDYFDRLDVTNGTFPLSTVAGLRIASVVPCPSSWTGLALTLTLLAYRRRAH